jgi:hypothetical protein
VMIIVSGVLSSRSVAHWRDTMRFLTAKRAPSRFQVTALTHHNVSSHERIGLWYLLMGIALLLLLASASRA